MDPQRESPEYQRLVAYARMLVIANKAMDDYIKERGSEDDSYSQKKKDA